MGLSLACLHTLFFIGAYVPTTIVLVALSARFYLLESVPSLVQLPFYFIMLLPPPCISDLTISPHHVSLQSSPLKSNLANQSQYYGCWPVDPPDHG